MLKLISKRKILTGLKSRTELDMTRTFSEDLRSKLTWTAAEDQTEEDLLDLKREMEKERETAEKVLKFKKQELNDLKDRRAREDKDLQVLGLQIAEMRAAQQAHEKKKTVRELTLSYRSVYQTTKMNRRKYLYGWECHQQLINGMLDLAEFDFLFMVL